MEKTVACCSCMLHAQPPETVQQAGMSLFVVQFNLYFLLVFLHVFCPDLHVDCLPAQIGTHLSAFCLP